MPRRILSVALIFGLAGIAFSADNKVERPKADPASTPLELTITGKTTKYTLDTGGLSAADYKKKIEAAANDGPIRTPAVDLTIELKNTSDKTVTVWTSGDPVVLTLELNGKGAVNLTPPLAFTTNFAAPKGIAIEAGKSHTIPLKALVSGFRGGSKFSTWTQAGDYELVATLKTGMTPAPKGAKDFDGFGVVTVTSPAFKLTVEEKK
ncbi:MAG: hypothetical protein C0467_11205 [Planctomycetaceae bacterium]|nr:hypothetical protein [Planctomycetaceae bacterium]